jgi:F-type H+-transporting ATPase subunit b
MLQTLQIFGDSSSGIGALGVDGQAFLIQLITFVLVILILRRWAVKPILKILNERRETIEKGVKLGEQLQKDQAALEAKIAAELHKTRAQADKIIAEAQVAGRQAIQEAEEAARTKAEGLITQASERIKQDTALARKRLEKDVASLVSEATEAIIHEKVDAKKDASLIDRALKETAR